MTGEKCLKMDDSLNAASRFTSGKSAKTSQEITDLSTGQPGYKKITAAIFYHLQVQ